MLIYSLAVALLCLVPPDAPSGVSLIDYTLSWGAVAGATSYDVSIDGAVVSSVATPSAELTGLAAGSVTVAALGDGGTSAASAAVHWYGVPVTVLPIPAQDDVRVVVVTLLGLLLGNAWYQSTWPKHVV
jgi:hypothetical protein